MEPKEALVILEALANGVDPFTGEIYPPESPYQKAETVRALFMAIRELEAKKPRKEKKVKLGPDGTPLKKMGSAWTEEEDEALKAAFLTQSTVAELSEAHQRTAGGIRARLVRLGLIDERGDAI